MKMVNTVILLGIISSSMASAQGFGNATKYPTLAKLCAGAHANHSAQVSLGGLSISPFEVVMPVIECQGDFLKIDLMHSINSGVTEFDETINASSIKVVRGSENGHPTYDLIVKTDVGTTVSHSELQVDANGQPTYGKDRFSGTVPESKTSGMTFSEPHKSAVLSCAILEDAGTDCDASSSREFARAVSSMGYPGAVVTLTNIAPKLPTNTDPVMAVSRVNFNTVLTELSALADESAPTKLSDEDARNSLRLRPTRSLKRTNRFRVYIERDKATEAKAVE